jgi:hypothetical protein
VALDRDDLYTAPGVIEAERRRCEAAMKTVLDELLEQVRGCQASNPCARNIARSRAVDGQY